jgi:hypothetical protein
MSLRNRFGFSIVLLILIGTYISFFMAIIQVGNRVIIAYQSIYMYLGIGILIIIERDHLEDFCIDRFAFILMIMSTVFRSRVGIDNESVFLYLYLVIGSVLLFVYISRFKKIQKTNANWILISVISSIIISLLLSVVDNTFKSLTNFPYSVLTLIREIFRGMFAVPIEEFIFRGFLWGYLLKTGISMKKAMWIQIVMFWSMHIFEIGNIPFFMITLPLGIYFFSFLRKHSNNLSPSIVSHLLFNIIREIVYF